MKFGRRGLGGPAGLSLLFQSRDQVGQSTRVSGGPWWVRGWVPPLSSSRLGSPGGWAGGADVVSGSGFPWALLWVGLGWGPGREG